jgi:amino acid adenylation domain-containing protein
MLAGPEGERLERYWRSQLRTPRAEIELPTDKTRPSRKTYRGATTSARLDVEPLTELRRLARECSATPYVVLLALFDAMLFRLTGTEDVVVGTPTFGRTQDDFASVAGHFVSPVPVRVHVRKDMTFRELIGRVRTTVHEALDHQDYPLFLMVQGSQSHRDASRSPIFETFFSALSVDPFRSHRSAETEAAPTDDLIVAPFPLRQLEGQFDLAVQVVESEQSLEIDFKYATDLFDAGTIDRMLAQYVLLLRNVVTDVDRHVGEIPLLTADDTRIQLEQINTTAHEYDRGCCLPELVARVAGQNRDTVAVEAADGTLTYAALDLRANQLAHLLIARGVGRESLVGVCLDRTASLPVALLGVLKAGAAYVPLDPNHPQERLTYTVQDARVACVITQARFAPSLAAAGAPLLVLDDDPALLEAQPIESLAVQAAPGDLAYVIYTSGSTGRPKGVEIEHRSLVNFLQAMQREPGIQAHDVLLAVTTPSFDIAGLELFLPLVTGARVVIASREDVIDGARLAGRLQASGATIMQATPATWRLLIDAGWSGRPSLTALCGGEALTRDLARDLSSRVRVLWNMYGPTETTIWSTVQRVGDHSRTVPIGHPIANTSVYILDTTGGLSPIGVPGELCIGGAGVARGYRNRPDLTAEKFASLSLPGRPSERVYRTGDVVRLRSDLALEFIGRRDDQVKLRGYRIELGEIESVLAEHPSVRESVVVVREDLPGDRRLAAYVVPSNTDAVPDHELRAFLRGRLPEYMVPSVIVSLAQLPLTANGKVDRRALPVPTDGRPATPVGTTIIMTAVQARVAAIWRSVLRVERVGLHENFFDLGGHSLLVVRMQAALKRDFGRDVTVVDLFQRTTIAAQAELFSENAEESAGLRRARTRLARQVFA